MFNHSTSTSLLIHSGGQALSTKGFGTKTLHPWYPRATSPGSAANPKGAENFQLETYRKDDVIEVHLFVKNTLKLYLLF